MFIPLFILAIALILIFFIWINKGHNGKDVSFTKVHELFQDWNGWIELLDDGGKPLFQGKILKINSALWATAIGVMIEKNVPADFLEDFKTSNQVDYLIDKKILGKFIFDFQSSNITKKLQDQELINKLEKYIQDPSLIKSCLTLNSHEMMFVKDNDKENSQKYQEQWDEISSTSSISY